MRLIRILALFLAIIGTFGCSTPQVRRQSVNKGEIQRHSNQNMQEMQRSLKQEEE